MVGMAGMTMVMSRAESSVERHRGIMIRAVLAAEGLLSVGASSSPPPCVDDAGGAVDAGPSESRPDGWLGVMTAL